MAALINRNPNGRLICLHALTKTLNKKFKKKTFTINDLKYDANSSNNITDDCELLIKLSSVKNKVCPYLANPTSRSKCYLTQSIQLDTQKSKSASDAMNALDGLGLVKRSQNTSMLTSQGNRFASSDFKSKQWLQIARSSVLGYGPFMGLLYEVSKKANTKIIEIKKSDISLGYPDTSETIRENGNLITLSTGSQGDTITRTRAVLFSWAVSTGFAVPKHIPIPVNESEWHVKTRNYVEKSKWSVSTYKFSIPKDLFNGEHFVARPLNYEWMTKSTKALRERGQGQIRSLSLKYEPRIKNRRFALVYALAKCAENKKCLDFHKFITSLLKHPQLFVINDTKFENIMKIEANISVVCGLPFDFKNGKMKPLTKINISILKDGAPSTLIKVLDKII